MIVERTGRADGDSLSVATERETAATGADRRMIVEESVRVKP
jgi:hypothetical protein